MTRRAIRQERRAQEEAKWVGFSPEQWQYERDMAEEPQPERDRDDDQPPVRNFQ